MQSIGPKEIMGGIGDSSNDIPKLQQQTSPESKYLLVNPAESLFLSSQPLWSKIEKTTLYLL